jgi:membrane protein DedA with SNARE-associated domain
MCWMLLGLSLLHEDVALVTAGLLVVQHGLPPMLAGSVLFCGAYGGDLGIYGLGASARSVPWLRRVLIGPNVDRVRHWLDRHLVRAVCLSRLVPGVLFPTYVACGWFRLPFRRFALATFLGASLYTTVAFAVILTFGETVLRHVGHGVWAALAVLLATFSAVRARHPRWGMADVVPEHHPLAAIRELLRRSNRQTDEPCEGLPSVRQLKRRVAVAERIPPWLFYIPVGICWAGLAVRHRGFMLPFACNPNIATGGFWGESKSGVLDQICPEQQRWVAPYVALRLSQDGAVAAEDDFQRAIQAMQAHGLTFPLVVKPDIGWQGFGVQLVPDASRLRIYLGQFPAGETVILQRYVPYDGEAGVLYARVPGEATGRVVSLTLRYFAFVTGDGKASLRELIRRDERARFKATTHLGRKPLHAGMADEALARVPAAGEVVRLAFIGSIRVGGLYRDARTDITDELSARFDAIARSMPEFHYGRFDIRFASLERLKAGEDFAIFEINGAGAEAIHVWDPEMSLRQVYRSLFDALALLFRIGHLNRDRGFKPCSFWQGAVHARRQHRLILRYPPST